MCKIDKMAKHHFLRSKKGSQCIEMGVLGVIWKSGLGILIQASKVPFLAPPKRKRAVLGFLQGMYVLGEN